MLIPKTWDPWALHLYVSDLSRGHGLLGLGNSSSPWSRSLRLAPGAQSFFQQQKLEMNQSTNHNQTISWFFFWVETTDIIIFGRETAKPLEQGEPLKVPSHGLRKKPTLCCFCMRNGTAYLRRQPARDVTPMAEGCGSSEAPHRDWEKRVLNGGTCWKVCWCHGMAMAGNGGSFSRKNPSLGVRWLDFCLRFWWWIHDGKHWSQAGTQEPSSANPLHIALQQGCHRCGSGALFSVSTPLYSTEPWKHPTKHQKLNSFASNVQQTTYNQNYSSTHQWSETKRLAPLYNQLQVWAHQP